MATDMPQILNLIGTMGLLRLKVSITDLKPIWDYILAVPRLERLILASDAAAHYEALCQSLQEDITTYHCVTLAQLASLPPVDRLTSLPHCLLTCRAQLWDLAQLIHTATSEEVDTPLFLGSWQSRPPSVEALTYVCRLPLLYRRIAPCTDPSPIGENYTERLL